MNLKEIEEKSKQFERLGFTEPEKCAIAAEEYGEAIVFKCAGVPPFAQEQAQAIYNRAITQATAPGKRAKTKPSRASEQSQD